MKTETIIKHNKIRSRMDALSKAFKIQGEKDFMQQAKKQVAIEFKLSESTIQDIYYKYAEE